MAGLWDWGLLIAFLLLVSLFLFGNVNHYRKRLQEIGDSYTRQNALKDISINQLMVVLLCNPFAILLKDFSPAVSGWLYTFGYVSVAVWFVSRLLFRIPSSEDRLARHKILKEIEESPDGKSNTLVQDSQNAGIWKWVLTTFLLLIGVGLLFLVRSYPLTTLLLLSILAVLICLTYLYFCQIKPFA
jgi:hypothetical protein